MRGLYITSVAYWHLGHFEAILNVICHKFMMTFNHILRFFRQIDNFQEQLFFISITPKVQGLLSYQILIWNISEAPFFQNCKNLCYHTTPFKTVPSVPMPEMWKLRINHPEIHP